MTDKRYTPKELDDFIGDARSVRDDGELFGKRAFDEVCRNFRCNGDEGTVAYLQDIVKNDEVMKRKLYNFSIALTGLGNPFRPLFAPAELGDGALIDIGFKIPEFDSQQVNCAAVNYSRRELDEFIRINGKEPTFGDVVFRFMKEKGLEPPQVYKRAYIRRQDFSRLTGPKCTGMRIGKVFNVAIGLGLNLDETDELLHSAGFWLKGTAFEMVVCFFIKHGIYDVPVINAELDKRGLETLTQYENVYVGDDYDD